MFVRFALAATLALAASAAPAAGISETHAQLHLPPAKGLAPVYRPLAKTEDCRVQPVRVAPPGKIAQPEAATRCATPAR